MKNADNWVYFVQRGDGGPIKIGFSCIPSVRISQLQVGCAEKLIVLACVRGNVKLEGALHDKLADHALRGEWFTPHPEVLNAAARFHAMLADADCPVLVNPPTIIAIPEAATEFISCRRGRRRGFARAA